MARQYLFEIPLPLRGLSPNGGAATSRWGVARARKKYREQCQLALMDERYERPPAPLALSRVHLVVSMCRKRTEPGDTAYRPLDAGNLWYAMKPALDALKDVGVIVDDKLRNLQLGDVRFRKVESWGEEGIAVRLERLDEEGSD